MKVTVQRGLAHDVLLAKMLRDNGFHIVHVHNGLILKHGKLESPDGWIQDIIEEWVNQHQGESKKRKGSGKRQRAVASQEAANDGEKGPSGEGVLISDET